MRTYRVLLGVVSLLSMTVLTADDAAAQTAAPSKNPAPTHPPATQNAADPGTGVATDAADIVARAGATVVTLGEVRAYLNQLNPTDKAVFVREPRLLSQAVRAMIANQLVLKDALAKKWEQQPAVAAQLDRVRRDAIVETYLRSVSTPAAGFPSAAEIENAYEANKTAFLMPRQYQLSQIVVALSQGADKDTEDKARKKLDDIQKRLKAQGADFAALAISDSDDRETSAQGGDLGWLPETQLRPEVRALVVGLSANTVSDPVRIDDGWHIFRLRDTKAAFTRPLADVRDLLTQRLREERAAANRRAFVAKLGEQSPPAINELSLSKLLGDTDQKASSN